MKNSLREISEICGGKLMNCPEASAGIQFESYSTNTRKNCGGSLFFAFAGEKFDAHDFLHKAIEAGALALCVSEDRYQSLKIPEDIFVLVVKDTLKAYQRLANYHRRKLDLKMIALTGSNGKTSTKEILNHILCHAFGTESVYATEGNTNNHVGVPQNLLNLNEKHKYAIIEMGTNHFGEIEALSEIAEPDIGIIVSIGNAHLEYLIDMDGVAREKSAIFAKMNPSGTAVIPAEGAGTAILDKVADRFKTLRFGSEKSAGKCDVSVKYIGSSLKGSKFEIVWKNCGLRRIVEWPLLGRHQAMNAAAAALGAFAAGIPCETVTEALSGNIRLPGMRTKIQEKDDILWINDAYNANSDSVRAGIEWLADALENEKPKGNIFIVLGDMLELGESGIKAHKEALEFLSMKIPSAKIITVGSLMKSAESLLPSGTTLKPLNFPDSAQAAIHIRSALHAGDMIYLKGSRGMALERIEEQ